MANTSPKLSVSDFIALTNQTLEYAYPHIEIEGEVSGFKVNQGKFVFFDLKDSGASVGCFMMLFSLRVPIEDGMKVIVTASPKLTAWGKFSLTVKVIRPSGEGSLKKSYEILKAKLAEEGLFAVDRKRSLPVIPKHIAVISSTQAAGYADFVKILNDRWGGVKVDVAQVQVQGASAPDQMIRALQYFNSQEQLPEVIVIIRGGGSADDLSAFNDEPLVRAIAASRVPTLVGVGHEIDESLADMAADVRAATPSNAAQIIVPDKNELIRSVRYQVASLLPRIDRIVSDYQIEVRERLLAIIDELTDKVTHQQQLLAAKMDVLQQMNPTRVLQRGYAILRGTVAVGQTLQITTKSAIIKAEIKEVEYDEK
ncbi:MAG: exodeoxyribonuclease VII large subunit [Chloroflexi bacterium]|nr:MAG: exodeoxyribonuclease VII large subunit [Chloroflexota bacterium]